MKIKGHTLKYLLSTLRYFLFLALLNYASSVCADDGSGLKTSAALDLVGTFKGTKQSTANDRFDVREAEFLLYGPIDHLFDGMLNVAAHNEGGVSLFEVHEAYIGSSKLIPRSRFRLGQFFLGLGRLNRFHRHDWPFISAPKEHLEFFGSEAAIDTGGEYSYLMPLPFFLELTAGVTNGWTYGHVHDAGQRPRAPTHYGRATTYIDLPAHGGAQTSLNYLSRTSAQGDAMTLVGADLTAKWREAGALNALLQTEAWQRTIKPLTGTSERSFGMYVFPQFAVSEQTQLGLLLDYFTVLTLKNIVGTRIANAENRLVPTLTYRTSEFVTLRLAYDWSVAKQANIADRKNQIFQVQATVNLGAHPSHDF